MVLELSGGKSDFFTNMSVPNDELASQNLISEPEEIEDSEASNYDEVRRKNEQRRIRQLPNQIVFDESQKDGGRNAVSRFDGLGEETSVTRPGHNNCIKASNHILRERISGQESSKIQLTNSIADQGGDVQLTEKDTLQQSLEAH